MPDRDQIQAMATQAAQAKCYKVKRAAVKGKLERLRKYVKDLQVNENSVDEAKCRIARDENIIQDFEEYQAILESLEADPDCEVERETFENTYYSAMGTALKKIRDYEASLTPQPGQPIQQAAAQPVTTARISLPKIDLPHFDGKHEDWLPFKEMFQSLVHHNDNIDAVQKLHYLRTALNGSAAKLIDTLPLTAQSYDTAWDLLNERYQNTKVILQHLLQSLVDFDRATKESSKQL